MSDEINRTRILHASKVFMTPRALKADGQEMRGTRSPRAVIAYDPTLTQKRAA
ncbi:hypothetical protein [Paraburkholderia saeva]|uniref:hypothetical protein n=1 Tax=Paraburkholderia saeva TaxID=2777537 RepID=UPI001E657F2C|nr:hypothetical protein [Paraburkholderia saeva]